MEEQNLKQFLYEQHAKNSWQTIPIRLKKQSREYLPEILAKFDMNKGAEIGVASGDFSEYLCQNIPNLNLLCVDAWDAGVDRQGMRLGQQLADSRYEQTKQRLSKYDVKIVKALSMDAVRDVPHNSLDFVYIDAGHEFDDVMQDIIEWGKRVRPGGLIAGHDYWRFRASGVIEAVDTYLFCHKITEAFITNELVASWFFCKN